MASTLKCHIFIAFGESHRKSEWTQSQPKSIFVFHLVVFASHARIASFKNTFSKENCRTAVSRSKKKIENECVACSALWAASAARTHIHVQARTLHTHARIRVYLCTRGERTHATACRTCDTACQRQNLTNDLRSQRHNPFSRFVGHWISRKNTIFECRLRADVPPKFVRNVPTANHRLKWAIKNRKLSLLIASACEIRWRRHPVERIWRLHVVFGALYELIWLEILWNNSLAAASACNACQTREHTFHNEYGESNWNNAAARIQVVGFYTFLVSNTHTNDAVHRNKSILFRLNESVFPASGIFSEPFAYLRRSQKIPINQLELQWLWFATSFPAVSRIEFGSQPQHIRVLGNVWNVWRRVTRRQIPNWNRI